MARDSEWCWNSSIELDIGDVDQRAIKDGPTREEIPGGTRGKDAMHLGEGFRSVVVLRDEIVHLAVEPIDGAEEPVAQAHGTSHDGVEDRLHVRRRPADHTQDLRRRRLLLEGLGDLSVGLSERPVLLLQLGKEPHVLDGDHRLVREGLQQVHEMIRERAGLGAGDGNGPDELPIAQHGHGQPAPPAAAMA